MPTIPGTYTELKRGRKPCPNCEAIIGAGRRKCPACSQVFGAAAVDLKSDEPELKLRRYLIVPGTEIDNSSDVLIVPAGNCPKRLTSSAPAVVKQWMRDVAEAYVPTGKRERTALSVEALTWWAREFFPLDSTGYRQVKAILHAHISPQRAT